MKKTAYFLFALIAFCACGQSSDGNQNNNAGPIVQDGSPADSLALITDPQIATYYELDDKYSASSDTESISQWWNGKLETIKKSGIKDDIFSSSGGGPNGAQWNAEADLYFAVLFPAGLALKNGVISISLNKKPVDIPSLRSQMYDHGIMVDFVLKKDIWTGALREIRQDDYIPLYGQERMDAAEKDEGVFVAPMDAGEIFIISIEIEGKSKEKMIATACFHVAYGE